MASFTFVREMAAPPETVFDVLTDHRAYPDFTPIRRAELEREGDPEPGGVGAIRVLRAVGPPMREEVIAYERPARFSYTLISGLPFRDHIGTVSLEATEAGTTVTYAVKTTPTLPVGGGLAVAALERAIRQLLGGVAGEAKRRAAEA